MNLEDYRKGYYYPEGTSKHYQHEVSKVNLGFKNPRIEYLLTKWHHGMLSIMTARIITLETQIMARPLDDPLNT